MHSECTVTHMSSLEPVILEMLQFHARTGNITTVVPSLREDNVFSRVRCPLCAWRPNPSSRWCCDPSATPEPYFAGCGTLWNTFSTRGQCPGCDHQWRWTSCLQCEGWSLHQDWYEESGS